MSGRNRREGVAALALATLLAAVPGCRRDVWEGAPVVLISVDTLRADHLPAYGYRGVATPHLDALRKDSILFANAYSHVPLTLASHATIFTGLLPFENGVRDNYGFALPPKADTLASSLGRGGYATGGAVSAAVLEQSTGIGRGFEFFDDGGGVERREGGATAAALLTWLQTVRSKKVFVFLHLFEPHAPYLPPEPFKSRYPLAYDGAIARADEIVGDFLARLKEAGIYDRAVLLLLSDHGEGLGEHGEKTHGIFLYREAIHVPLFVKLPGSARAGESVAAPVALVDVFPTIARAVGLAPPQGLTGRALTDHAAALPRARRVYSETLYPRFLLGWSDLTSLVDDKFQYIEAPRPELYDIAVDPGERNNLAASLPPALRSMRAELLRLPRTPELPTASDPEHAKKLASLGYLTATSPDAGKQYLPDPKDMIEEYAKRPDLAALMALKDYDQLVIACREWVVREPASMHVWRILADALDRQGKRAEAIEALQQGLRVSAGTVAPPVHQRALERLVELLVREGRAREALEIADTAAFTDPGALNAVGIAQAGQGRPDLARQTLEKAVALEPKAARSSVNLASVCLSQGDLAKARELLEKAVAIEPKSGSAWSALGLVRVRQGDESGALACWRHALDLDPEDYRTLFNLAIAEGNQGDVAAARSALEQFVRHAPPDRYARDLAEARRLLRALNAG